MNSLRLRAVGLVCGLACLATAHAGYTPYPAPGSPNPQLYSFTAAADGDLIAYFSGGAGGLVNEFTALVNGVPTGVQGLNNHVAAYGQVLNFGHVAAGDSVVFEMVNLDQTVGPWYSTKSLNADGGNHVYSTAFTADALIPSGTYIAFEDLTFPGSDYNYGDGSFVVTNLTTTVVPEPESYALMLAGLGLVGLLRRRAVRPLSR